MEKCETNVLQVSFLLCVKHICLISNLSQIWMFMNTSVTLRETNVLRDKCAPTVLWLFNEIYLSIKFRGDIFYSFRGMSRVKFKVWKWTKSNNSKLDKAVLRFFWIAVLSNEIYGSCALQTYSMRSIYLQSFILIPLIVLESCPGQSSKCKNKQSPFIQKLGKAELRFLCTAHLLNEIYLPTKLLPLVVSKLCPGQEKPTDGQTGGRTDKVATIYMLTLREAYTNEGILNRVKKKVQFLTVSTNWTRLVKNSNKQY
jgi:hypothetical protein